MDPKNIMNYIFTFLTFFLPLVQSFFFTNDTESWFTNGTQYDNETESLYTTQTPLYNIVTEKYYTTPTPLTEIEHPKIHQEIIVREKTVTEQPYKTYDVFEKKDTQIVSVNETDQQLNQTYDYWGIFSASNETETEPPTKVYEIRSTKETETEPPAKVYEISVTIETEEEKLSKPIDLNVNKITKEEQPIKPYDTKTEQIKKPYDIFEKNLKNEYKANQSLYYISPPEYNPNLSMTPNYSPFLNLKGRYCEKRSNPQCCPNRQDDCSVPVLGTLCYCDHFCDRAPKKGDKHGSPDCCPDYYTVCTNSPTEKPPPRPSRWSPWSPCSKTCGLGEERRTRSTNKGTETERRPCLESRCPLPPQEQCGGFLRGASGTIDYPAGSGNYPNGANCRWIIATQPYTNIELNILSFSTQRQHDYLTIREHNISTFSANMSGIIEGVIMTASNIVTLIFTSDDSFTSSGFIINWRETIAPSLSVEVWMCKDAWPVEECFFNKENSNGGLVCNCRDAQARGWCETDFKSTRRVCEATCNPLCTPHGYDAAKGNFKSKQEKKMQGKANGNPKSLPLIGKKKN